MEIPIQNIYYLLCYCWDKLDEKDVTDVDSTAFNNVYDLYAKVLIKGIHHLLKRGLDRSYSEVSDAIKGIKGKIEIGESLDRNLFPGGSAFCTYDELDYDVSHNRILKSTVYGLMKIP